MAFWPTRKRVAVPVAARVKKPCTFMVTFQANAKNVSRDHAAYREKTFPVSQNGWRRASALMDALRYKGVPTSALMTCDNHSIFLLGCRDSGCSPDLIDTPRATKRAHRKSALWADDRVLAGIPKKKKRK